MAELDEYWSGCLRRAVRYACSQLAEEENEKQRFGPSVKLATWRKLLAMLKQRKQLDIPSQLPSTTTSEWISVDDWLPNHDREVLTWDKAQLCISVYHACDNEWVTDLGDPSDELGYTCTLTPTHWMPIPPPPRTILRPGRMAEVEIRHDDRGSYIVHDGKRYRETEE